MADLHGQAGAGLASIGAFRDKSIICTYPERCLETDRSAIDHGSFNDRNQSATRHLNRSSITGFAMLKPPVGKSMTVPYGADETIYVVVDRLGRRDGLDREIEVERPDIETIMAELMSGRFNDPIRVVAFNTLEHWAKDISAEIAAEIRVRCDIEGEDIPEYIRDFAASFPEPARSRGTPGSRDEPSRIRSIAAV